MADTSSCTVNVTSECSTAMENCLKCYQCCETVMAGMAVSNYNVGLNDLTLGGCDCQKTAVDQCYTACADETFGDDVCKQCENFIRRFEYK